MIHNELNSYTRKAYVCTRKQVWKESSHLWIRDSKYRREVGMNTKQDDCKTQKFLPSAFCANPSRQH